jgi:hypothetical protein
MLSAGLMCPASASRSPLASPSAAAAATLAASRSARAAIKERPHRPRYRPGTNHAAGSPPRRHNDVDPPAIGST